MSRSSGAMVTTGRAVSAAMLTASLILGTASSPTPAAAEGTVVRDHRAKDAWVEVVINKIIIHDDEDWGDGEFRFTATVSDIDHCATLVRWDDCTAAPLVKSSDIRFSGGDGHVETLNRVVPRQGDTLSTSLDENAGETMHPGKKYGIEVRGVELDTVSDDEMGVTNLVLNEDSDWGIGIHTVRGWVASTITDITCDPFPLCANDFGGKPAHYSVEFEVRRVALADLTPESIKIVNREEGKAPDIRKYKEICLTVGNIGPKVALGYDVNFLVDNVPYKGNAGAAYPGDHDEVCAQIADPALGEHQLNAIIAGTPEMDLSNNEMKSTYVRTVIDDIRAPIDDVGGVLSTVDGPSAGPADTGQTNPTIVKKEESTAPPSVELSVGSIQVKTKNSSGKSDCDPGKNDVVVNVKNEGDVKASNLMVRLTVDGDDPKEKPLGNLEPGKDSNVEFNDVQLKRGQPKLAVSVSSKDSTGTLAEDSRTLTCQDE